MDPQTEEQQDDGAARLAQQERLQQFGATLAATRDKWIRARTARGWDQRVQEDLDRYHMRDEASRRVSSMMDSVQQGYPMTSRESMPTRSTVFVGITRQRTNASEARLADILLPTDDKNWGIGPTPDPECAMALKSEDALIDPATGQPVLVDENGAFTNDPSIGRPLTKKEVARATERAAKVAAEAMATEIDDQFVECDWNAEQRKMIHDAAVMGTGVVKGPLVDKASRLRWRTVEDNTGVAAVPERVSTLRPASFRVDPRMVWEDPACGDDVQNGTGIFELELLTAKRVRDLAKQGDLYMRDQLVKVIEEGPKRTSVMQRQVNTDDERTSTEDEDLYYHWIYWGELNAEDLKSAGIEVSDDPLASISGCVEMIGDTVVRAYLNPLESGELPYDFFPWEKVQGSCRGYGVSYLMKAEQSVTNGAWRQMMDNSGSTAGPQVVVNRRLVRPMDTQWTLRPFKFWDLLDDTADPARAFHSVEFASHQSEMAGIIELAEKLGDQSSGNPMMVTGEKGTAPETVGGMQLLMNNANIVLKRLTKQYDDYVTKRHVRRYYEYNMLHSPKKEIKGDFQVDARGSTALLVRDIQNQAFLEMMAASTNPAFAPMINHKRLFEKALKAKYIDPKDVLLSDDKIEQNLEAAAQQKDPRIETAMINAQARLKQAEAVAQNRAVETEVMREAEVENRRLRVLQLGLEHDLEILRMAQTEKMSLAQVQAMLAQTAIQDRTKKELAASEMLFKKEASPDGQGI